MSLNEVLVREFHEVFRHPVGLPFEPEAAPTLDLRVNLIIEEARELVEAASEIQAQLEEAAKCPSQEQLAHLLKELCDLQYVTSGFAVAFDLPLTDAFIEVHKSNMSKLNEDYEPIFDENGKILKGDAYKPPDLLKFFSDSNTNE